jgi:diguanylate cyclase (GGDEF)-like protein
VLAKSFNVMSSRISRQLEVLTALSGIDRLILTRLKIEDIVSVIMTRTTHIISSDMVSMALVDKESESFLTIYTSHSSQRHKVEESQCPISEEEAIQLAVAGSFTAAKKDQQPFPNYLSPLSAGGAQYFLILPVMINHKLVAILSLGFVDRIKLTEEDQGWARDYVGRIAVALSNASWEEKMYYQAHYDVLTGLPNRQFLYDQLKHAMAQARRDDFVVGVLFIDLDRFKSINDSLGHTVGDQLLKAVSQRISHCIRKEDSVARMGGDEFVVILSTNDQGKLASSYVAAIADKLLKHIAEPLMLEEHEIRVSASIGIVIYPDDGVEIETLIKNADSAMYHAKDKGKGNYQFYSEELNESSLNKLLLESDLIGAVDREEFELYYQPKVDAKTGKMQGAEGLIRWNHPTKGLISPFRFIPFIEESHLIITVGEWVIRSACFQNKKWQQQGLQPILVAVNVAVKQLLHPGFVDGVASAIKDSGLESRWLELEITESAAMDDMKGTITVLHELKKLGVSLSIDDYGTGYSSLQYMKDFPVDVLKIDQSFVFNLLTSSKDAAIIQSTILLAHSFGLKVIAEGVETEAHQKYLAELGCDELQGYLFSRPVPVDEFALLFGESLLPDSAGEESDE